MSRAGWDEVWAIDEQLSGPGLPVGAGLSIGVIHASLRADMIVVASEDDSRGALG